MQLAEPIRPIRLGHWTEGGTGVTNMSNDIDERRTRYMQAALNLGINGLTIINRTMDGREGWSLHDCRPGKFTDLSAFWAEVKRLGGY